MAIALNADLVEEDVRTHREPARPIVIYGLMPHLHRLRARLLTTESGPASCPAVAPLSQAPAR